MGDNRKTLLGPLEQLLIGYNRAGGAIRATRMRQKSTKMR